jgi:hypothetical protein
MNETIPEYMEPSKDRLVRLKEAVASLRDLELEKANLAEKLSGLNASIQKYTREDLPDLFLATGLSSLTLEPQGNLPAYTAKLETEVKAVIQKDWPPEQREAAFSWLHDQGADDLIKATITVTFDKEEVDKAKALRRVLVDEGYNVNFEMTVHHMTLSSWLRERWSSRNMPPNISTIGGYVGPVVRLATKKGK